jgi:hypothetical protein
LCADGAYASIVTWEAGEAKDITGLGVHYVNIIGDWSGTVDTSSTIINGFITDSTHYVLLHAPVDGGTTVSARHSGVSDFTKFKAVNGGNDDIIFVYDDDVRIDGIQLLHTGDSGAGYSLLLGSLTASNDIRLSNLIITRDAGTDHDLGSGIYINDSDANVMIWNCLVYQPGGDTEAGKQFGIVAAAASSVTVYNTGVYNWRYGIYVTTGNVWAYNSWVYKNQDDFFGITVDHCASDDNDGTNNVDEGTWDDNFVDRSGTSNFKLVDNANLDDSGTDDPSGGVYSTDIEGDNYISTWPVGFHEPDTGVAEEEDVIIPPQIIERLIYKFAKQDVSF